jgi:putative aldouronate transport system permease protein
MAAKQNVYFLPRGLTFVNYSIIFSNPKIVNAFIISVSKTVLGTILFVLVTGLCAYAMSKPRLRGRKKIFIFFVIPMYVSGGLLPYYMVVHDLGLFNNFLVYILPTCYATFFMFLVKTYLETIPSSLEESAMLDGAGDLRIAWQIYIPLCKPVLATVALFIGVTQWNSWFDAMLFVSKIALQPLQLVLQIILKETQIENIMQLYALTQTGNQKKVNPESFKMAVLIITTLPIIFIYPFAQKYFVKGMMIGAVKL